VGVAADGIFGPRTDRAVRKFQSRNGLAVDGIVGARTRAALRAFQEARNLAPTGEPNRPTLTELGVE
jgi:peptidoglycan hydrolase-like protein with peptidoglycan-binding domain